jgi:hypothetical protein
MDDVKVSLRQFSVATYLPGEFLSSPKDETPLRASGILEELTTSTGFRTSTSRRRSNRSVAADAAGGH